MFVAEHRAIFMRQNGVKFGDFEGFLGNLMWVSLKPGDASEVNVVKFHDFVGLRLIILKRHLK